MLLIAPQTGKKFVIADRFTSGHRLSSFPRCVCRDWKGTIDALTVLQSFFRRYYVFASLCSLVHRTLILSLSQNPGPQANAAPEARSPVCEGAHSEWCAGCPLLFRGPSPLPLPSLFRPQFFSFFFSVVDVRNAHSAFQQQKKAAVDLQAVLAAHTAASQLYVPAHDQNQIEFECN